MALHRRPIRLDTLSPGAFLRALQHEVGNPHESTHSEAVPPHPSAFDDSDVVIVVSPEDPIISEVHQHWDSIFVPQRQSVRGGHGL